MFANQGAGTGCDNRGAGAGAARENQETRAGRVGEEVAHQDTAEGPLLAPQKPATLASSCSGMLNTEGDPQ